jgi:hypothetical protein
MLPPSKRPCTTRRPKRPKSIASTSSFSGQFGFGIARSLDQDWIKRGTTMYRELRALGASHEVAHRIPANSHRWWRNSGKLLNCVLSLAWFDRMGLPRFA